MKRGIIALLQPCRSGGVVQQLLFTPRGTSAHHRGSSIRGRYCYENTTLATFRRQLGTSAHRSTSSTIAESRAIPMNDKRVPTLFNRNVPQNRRRRNDHSRRLSSGAASMPDRSNDGGEEDPYDKYRQNGPVSSHILAELQLETLHTQRRFNLKVLEQARRQVETAWNRQQRTPPPPEPGPMGTWLYGFTIEHESTSTGDGDGDEQHLEESTPRRIYQRTWNDDHGPETRQQQLVLELEPHDEVLSLSLTVDESCIGCLVENSLTGQRQIRLRHIETEKQSTLEFGGDINEEDSLYSSLVGLEWGPMLEGDLHSLYLVGADDQGRPDRVLVSTVHSTVLHVEEPQLILHSQDPSEIVDVQRTKGCEYVSINVLTKTSNEIYLSAGPSSLELVMPRQENLQYHLDVGDQGDIVMLVSNDGSEYRLVETSVGALPMETQTVVAPQETEAVVITDMDLFRDFLVLYQTCTKTGCPQITIQDRGSTETSHSVTVPLTMMNDTPCIQVSPAGNICFGATSLRLLIETPVTPPTTYELDFQSNTLLPISVESSEMTEDDPIPHKQERIFVSGQDGTKVPMSIFYREDHLNDESSPSSASSWWENWFGSGSSSDITDEIKDGASRPVILMGYGAYGEPVNMGYDPCLLPLLEQGYVLAFAHTRGGGELGKAWYHAGRREHKLKVVEDFLACAEYVRDRWKGTLTARGFSAAGVMMGAAVNRRPELFDNLILTNPFLDLYATMIDPNQFLTAHEWDEFGNPLRDPPMDKLLRSYCPILNVSSNTDGYPRCLLIGTLDDDKVPFWNPAIFAKKIRDRMTSNEAKDRIFLHLEGQGGHHLGQQRLQISAMELAFILQEDVDDHDDSFLDKRNRGGTE